MKTRLPARAIRRLKKVVSPLPEETTPSLHHLGKYELIRELGSGGAGTVYEATDPVLQRKVAIKILSSLARSNETMKVRFLREARAMAGLTHPNVVAVHDVGESDDKMFLIMELVPGYSFRRLLLDREGEMRALVSILEQAARGVAAAHQQAIVHRDIKPANILLTEEGQPKVGDFGLAYVTEAQADLTRSGTQIGTPLYMAPEQVAGGGDSITPATDVHALGVILYEILTGRTPFLGESVSEIFGQILHEEAPAPRTFNANVPHDLSVICLRSLEKDPSRRYPNATAFADELGRWLRGEPIQSHAPSAVSRFGRWVWKRKAVIAVALTGLLVSGGLAGWLIPKWKEAADRSVKQERELREKTRTEEQHTLARPHLQSGFDHLTRLDRLLTSESATEKEVMILSVLANVAFRKALKIDPSMGEAHLGMARVARLNNENRKAAELCRLALEADPTLAGAHLDLALLLCDELSESLHDWVTDPERKPDEYLDRINRHLAAVREISKDVLELHLVKALQHFCDREYEEAGAIFESFAMVNPSEVYAWYWAGHAWMHARKHRKKAFAALSRALEYRPRHRFARMLRANAHMGERNFPESLADFDKLVKYAPEFVPAYVNRGAAKDMSGDLDGAVKDYNHALKLDPDNLPALNNRGQLLMRLNRLDDAMEDYGRILKLNPNFPEALTNRAVVYAKKGEFDKALADCDRAISLKRNMPEAYYNRGVTRARMGKPRSAIADFGEAIRLNPGYTRAFLARADAYIKIRQSSAALDDVTKAIKLNPRLPKAHTLQGDILRGMKRWKPASDAYQRALLAAPPDWPFRGAVRKHLEYCRSRLGS